MVIEESKNLFFPSLITWFYKEAEVKKSDSDYVKCLKMMIHAMKKKGLDIPTNICTFYAFN